MCKDFRNGFRGYASPCILTESEKKKIAYEHAVKAYQFQVTRYNTWMNYYALFVGALFVAFYMIICYSKSCSCASCYTCCSCNYQLPSTRFLLILITVLGIIASVCWMASLIGNCAWMNNYINKVKKIEAIFFGEKNLTDEQLIIYRYLNMKLGEPQATETRKEEAIIEEKDTNNGAEMPAQPEKKENQEEHKSIWKKFIDFFQKNKEPWLPGFISTQKMTQWFVGAILAAWIFILTYLIGIMFPLNNCFYILFALGSLFISFLIWRGLKHKANRFISDDLTGMKNF